jgi:cytochrome c-type biogenesis protein CcmE
VDVSPRTLTAEAPEEAAPARARRPRNVRAWLLAGVVLVALGFVVFRGLGNATLFFYNVDEAVAKKASLGSSRFRLQGSVVPGSVSRSDLGADFTVTYNGVDAQVRHVGDLPQLFQPNIPVVLEGRWTGDVFASDRVLVKHSEVYVARNPDRVKDYDEGSEAGVGADGTATTGGTTGPPATAGSGGGG